MILKKVIVALLFLSVFTSASDLKHINSFEDGLYLAKKQNKQMMLFIYSTHCPWCKKMERTTLSDSEVIDFINEKFVFVSLNKDIDDIPSNFIPYGVPTTYAIDKNGEKLYTMKGYKSKKSFLGRAQR